MITDRVDHVNRSVNCLLTLRVDSDHVKRSVNCFLTLLVDSRHGELVAKSRAHNNRNNRIKVRGNVINCHPVVLARITCINVDGRQTVDLVCHYVTAVVC